MDFVFMDGGKDSVVTLALLNKYLGISPKIFVTNSIPSIKVLDALKGDKYFLGIYPSLKSIEELELHQLGSENRFLFATNFKRCPHVGGVSFLQADGSSMAQRVAKAYGYFDQERDELLYAYASSSPFSLSRNHLSLNWRAKFDLVKSSINIISFLLSFDNDLYTRKNLAFFLSIKDRQILYPNSNLGVDYYGTKIIDKYNLSKDYFDSIRYRMKEILTLENVSLFSVLRYPSTFTNLLMDYHHHLDKRPVQVLYDKEDGSLAIRTYEGLHLDSKINSLVLKYGVGGCLHIHERMKFRILGDKVEPFARHLDNILSSEKQH